ncbi:uncharacterized protein PV06_11837 [Exophiala oligosperma]|uniref:Zn(2)-C6 fungal-type domain-containing protein n=1 Tax=Exophiala oligosperma TaxID=215243 RepID=A0A0D2CXM8_9EURO|nr:uncharacterized protein PV06_11837 [Exophiala oligosperma]KIW35833.1 hypothetical protein PV06_11837 [Exophiala oligosperma]
MSTPTNVKQEPLSPYATPPPPPPELPPQHPPYPIHHMPPSENLTLHNHYQQTAAAFLPPVPTWNSPQPPYSGRSEYRQRPLDLTRQHPYLPPGQLYPPPPAAVGREAPGYPADPGYRWPGYRWPGYRWPGSVAGRPRSPAELRRPPHHLVSIHDAPDYGSHPCHTSPDSQPNGIHHPFHVVTGHDRMAGQHPGPPRPYGPHLAETSPPAGYHVQSSYHNPDLQRRRKAVRAAEACDSCRQRKTKCDESRPQCHHCKVNGLTCTYRELPLKKSEKQIIDITGRLETINRSIEMLIQKSKTQDEKIDALSKALQQRQQYDIDTAPTIDGHQEIASRQNDGSTFVANFQDDTLWAHRREENSDVHSTTRPQALPTSPAGQAENQRGKISNQPCLESILQ